MPENEPQDALNYLEITTTEALAALCERLSAEPWLTIDTEFEREKTYWPILCLVQIASPHESAIIDPLANGIDLSPLFSLLDRPEILKVFHAGRQDLEIFYRLMGKVPMPIFDTQIAAMVCGFGESVGYEALVKNRLGIGIDKSWRVTNWRGRPLEKGQKDYAVADVVHLAALFPDLRAEVESKARLGWIEDEIEILSSEKTYRNDPDLAWKRIKGRINGVKQHGALVEIAKVREQEAQRLDIPRQRLLRDASMIELANRMPSSPSDIARLRSIPDSFGKTGFGQKAMRAIEQSRGQTYPSWEKPGKGSENKAEPAIVDLLRLLLKSIGEREGVATKLIASAGDLERLASGDQQDLAVLEGWRHEVFGARALDLLSGKLAVRVRGQSIVIEG